MFRPGLNNLILRYEKFFKTADNFVGDVWS